MYTHVYVCIYKNISNMFLLSIDKKILHKKYVIAFPVHNLIFSK